MAQTVQLAPLPCLQIGPSWMSYILHQNRCEVSLEVFPHRSDKQHTVPAPILLQAHPSLQRKTVKFKMCKRCKTQFDGFIKDTKLVREASQGPDKAYHLLPPDNNARVHLNRAILRVWKPVRAIY